MAQKRFIYFALLWSLAGQLELMEFHFYTLPAGWLHVASMVLVLCYPGFWTFLALLISGLVYVSLSTGNYLNNFMFEFFIDLGVSAVLICQLLQRRRSPDLDESYAQWAPLVRSAVVIFYFFSFIAKLNTDFLNPQTSCASTLTVSLVGRVWPSIHGPWLLWIKTLSIYAALAMELFITCLLFFSSGRHWAVIMGIILHTAIGLQKTHAVYAFSLLMLISYIVFFSNEAFACIHRWGRAAQDLWKRLLPSVFLRWPVTAIIVYELFALGCIFPGNTYYFTIWCLIYIPIAGAYLAAIWKTRKVRPPPASIRDYFWSRPAYLSLFVVVPMLANALMLYTGIKTKGGFAPFSNLRILGPFHNHLIFPSSMVVFNRDLVEILDSDNPYLKKSAARHFLIPPLEFRREVNRIKGKFFVTCMYQGRILVLHKNLDKVDDNPLLKPVPWMEQKVFGLQPVSNVRQRNCNYADAY